MLRAGESLLANLMRGPDAPEIEAERIGESRRLYIWLDGNVPFYGTYGLDEQLARHEGQALPPPTLQ